MGYIDFFSSEVIAGQASFWGLSNPHEINTEARVARYRNGIDCVGRLKVFPYTARNRLHLEGLNC